MKSMIEALYQKTRKIYFLMLLMFIFFYFVPFLTQVFLLGNDAKYYVNICNSSCLVMGFIFFVSEILRMRAIGAIRFLKSFKNLFELAQFPITLAYFVIRRNNHISTLVQNKSED